MRDLISWSYNIDTTDLIDFGDIYFCPYQDSYIYIIPVGDEKSTTFFHLLKFVNASPYFTHLFTREQAPTLLIHNTHYYALLSSVPLHVIITKKQLDAPVLYNQGYPVAKHFKSRWLLKNQIHEQELNVALDKVPSQLRSILFDIATYYIHLNEEAYRLTSPIENINYTTTLCHARTKPDTYLYEFFMPDRLVLDNRSRIYCEYIRHLFIKTGNLEEINDVVATILASTPLSEAEWQLLYARLYFPTHFYDTVYDIIHNAKVNLDNLYDQAMNYAELLAYLPTVVYQYTSIMLPVPEWVRREATRTHF